MKGYLAVVALAAFVTFLLVPVARSLALRFGVLAEPDTERRLHAKSMPLLGGAAMFGSRIKKHVDLNEIFGSTVAMP